MASYERLGQGNVSYMLKAISSSIASKKQEIEQLRATRQGIVKKLQDVQEQINKNPVSFLVVALRKAAASLKNQSEEYVRKIADAIGELNDLMQQFRDTEKALSPAGVVKKPGLSEPVVTEPVSEPVVTGPVSEPVVTEPVSMYYTAPVVTESEAVEIARAGTLGKNLPLILISGLVLFTAYKLFFEKRTGSRA